MARQSISMQSAWSLLPTASPRNHPEKMPNTALKERPPRVGSRSGGALVSRIADLPWERCDLPLGELGRHRIESKAGHADRAGDPHRLAQQLDRESPFLPLRCPEDRPVF